jgi:hypothetical protein
MAQVSAQSKREPKSLTNNKTFNNNARHISHSVLRRARHAWIVRTLPPASLPSLSRTSKEVSSLCRELIGCSLMTCCTCIIDQSHSFSCARGSSSSTLGGGLKRRPLAPWLSQTVHTNQQVQNFARRHMHLLSTASSKGGLSHPPLFSPQVWDLSQSRSTSSRLHSRGTHSLKAKSFSYSLLNHSRKIIKKYIKEIIPHDKRG